MYNLSKKLGDGKIILQKLILLIFILFALSSLADAQETSWLNQLKQVEPLKSTEKDIEKIFGKPAERYADVGEYETEAGTLTVTYSQGKCRINEDSEYDVEKGTVVEFSFTLDKNIKFKTLNINLVGFKKEYSPDALGAYKYKNKELRVSYSIGNGWLNAIYISPAKSYAYLSCPQKAKQDEPIIDDVNQESLINLTQLKPLQNTRTDVISLFGEPYKSEDEQLDFYLKQKYSLTFLYSTGKCTFTKDDNWSIPKEKIIGFTIGFNVNGISSSLDLSKLNKKEDKRGYSVYEDEAEGIQYEIKDNRIWQTYYYPSKKYDELKCKTR